MRVDIITVFPIHCGGIELVVILGCIRSRTAMLRVAVFPIHCGIELVRIHGGFAITIIVFNFNMGLVLLLV